MREQNRTTGSGQDGETFDHYARLVRRLLNVPVALVTIVEANRQVFAGMVGLQEPYSVTRETPLSHSFCQYVVSDGAPLIIADARADTRLAMNLAIRDMDVIAYAGWPLVDEAGRTVGSLCAIDSTPRQWRDDEIALLEDLALACSTELQARWFHSRESEKLANAILDSVNVAVAFYDVDGRLIMANRNAEDLAHAAGFDLYHPPYSGAHVRRADNHTAVAPDEQIIPRALRGELEDHGMEWFGPHESQVAVEASASKVLHSDGRPWGTLITAQDVTELARSLKAKDQFITTLSHELRTPLTSIIGYLEVLDDALDVGDGIVLRALESIGRNARQLEGRVQQLVDVAERRMQLTLAPADLSSMAAQVCEGFAPKAETTRVSVSVECLQPCWATVDITHVQAALECLVSNALKFTASGGSVVIAVGSNEAGAWMTVTDNGPGMSPAEVRQACDPFWRSEAVFDGAVQGLGLGLALVRNIVAAHQGSLDIDSQPDKGTSVTMRFPQYAAEQRVVD